MESCTLGDDEAGALGLDLGVPVIQHFGEVVAGVHVQDREGDPTGLERLGGKVEQDGRILATTEEEDGAL